MNYTLNNMTFETRLAIEPISDPVVDPIGHDPRSHYVERFWVPILGPTTTLLIRLLVERLERAPRSCTIDIAEAARCLGLGERSGPRGPFFRSLSRAIDFDMARVARPGAIAVRIRLPGLSPRLLARLPESLRAAHLADGVHRTEDTARRRGRQLALSLVRLGEDFADVERQLVEWRFDTRLAHDCAAWAVRAATSVEDPRQRAGRRPLTVAHPCLEATSTDGRASIRGNRR